MSRDLRSGAPCPPLVRNIILAERFGKWPWELESEPAELVLKYLQLFGVESQVHNDREGLGPDDETVRLA